MSFGSFKKKSTVATEDHLFERNGFAIGLSWVMSLIANNLGIALTIVYWVALADLEKDESLFLGIISVGLIKSFIYIHDDTCLL